MTFDLYVWKSPRELDGEQATALLAQWHRDGGDPAVSPFEPSTDVGWFHRELVSDAPELEVRSDAVPSRSSTPVWLSTEPEPPARMVAIRLTPRTSPAAVEAIFGLTGKYDLVLFDARNRRLHLPLEEMAAYADATFWPRGAIQAAVAGGVGALIAVVAWMVGIPLLSGLLAVVGGFMFVMAVYSFVAQGRKAVGRRRDGEPPPSP